MINPTKLRRTASVSNASLATTVDPSSLLSSDLWPSPVESPYAARSPPDPHTAAGPAMYLGKRVHSDHGFDADHSQLADAHYPKTPLRYGRGQSVSGLAYPEAVTPQSATRSFSVSSLPYTPARAQNYPLMSPMDTPLPTPSEHAADGFFEFGSSKASGWNFQFDLPEPLHPASTEPAIASELDSDTTLMASDFYKDMYQPRSESVLSSLDGTFDSVESDRFSSVPSVQSPGPGGHGDSFVQPSTNMGVVPEYGFDVASGFEAPATAATGVNPFYKPPSYLRRTRSEVVSRPDLAQNTDAGIDILRARSHSVVDFSNQAPVNMMARHGAQVTGPGPAMTPSNSGANNAAATDEKPYVCETCEKCFRRMEHLRRHMKTHTMERPYPCTVEGCERRFSRTDNLKAHILTHAKKTGRNVYVEGLAEKQDIKPIKRRKSRKSADAIPV